MNKEQNDVTIIAFSAQASKRALLIMHTSLNLALRVGESV